MYTTERLSSFRLSALSTTNLVIHQARSYEITSTRNFALLRFPTIRSERCSLISFLDWEVRSPETRLKSRLRLNGQRSPLWGFKPSEDLSVSYYDTKNVNKPMVHFAKIQNDTKVKHEWKLQWIRLHLFIYLDVQFLSFSSPCVKSFRLLIWESC